MSIERIDQLNASLSNSLTVLDLLRRGELQKTEDNVVVTSLIGSARAWKAFESQGVNVMMSVYDKDVQWPPHIHCDLVEYLIVVRGEYEIICECPEGSRIINLKYQDCFRVPSKVPHSVKCLTDRGELLAVCIPAETSYVSTK
jgi:mannose-6-phosphate isomerase-like protein (cupin superfamily)